MYNQYHERVLRYFVRRSFNAEVAADLTAETFAEALSSWGSRRNADAGGPWLFAIARHQLAHYYRRSEIDRRARQNLGMDAITLTESDQEAIQLMTQNEPAEPLSDALRALSSEQRDAVLLRVVDDLDYDEIAQRLGCSQVTARAKVSRGLRELRSALGVSRGSHRPSEEWQ